MDRHINKKLTKKKKRNKIDFDLLEESVFLCLNSWSYASKTKKKDHLLESIDDMHNNKKKS